MTKKQKECKQERVNMKKCKVDIKKNTKGLTIAWANLPFRSLLHRAMDKFPN